MSRLPVVKKRLSKNVLEMKFMKRTKEKTERDMENEERQAMFAHEISDKMRSQGGRFITEPSYAAIEDLMFGHRAYLGINPEIEKMTQAEEQAEEDTKSAKTEVDVSEQEMASHYATVGRKFATKRSFAAQPAVKTNVPDLEGQKLLERGAQLMTQHKSVNRTWSKDQQQQQHKRRKFQKPKEDD